MARNMPAVTANTLRYQEQGHERIVPVGTQAWYAWLQTAQAFSFRASPGQFTARRERASNGRGGWYWKAYWRREGKLCSAYLGKAEDLTLERLQAVAARAALAQAGDDVQSGHPPTAMHRGAQVELFERQYCGVTTLWVCWRYGVEQAAGGKHRAAQLDSLL